MAKKIYDSDGLDMRNTAWDGDETTNGLPVSGRLVENYIKTIDDNATPADEVAKGETKAPTSGAVFDSQVGMLTDIDVQDSEDGTQYVMSVTKRDENGEDKKEEIRFSKYTDDDKVVVSIDITDSGGAELPSSQYLSLGSGLVIKYAVGIGTAGGGEVSDYSDMKARVIMKRGSSTLADFQDTELTGVTAGQTYTFDASKYLTDATAYTIQVEAQATYQDAVISKTATIRVTMVSMSMETTYNVANGTTDGGYSNDVSIPFTIKGTSGEKNIYYRLNGDVPTALSLSAGSGVQSKNITVPLSSMKTGMNVLEAYAVHESSGVISSVHYITILKAGGVSDYAGIMFHHNADGFQADWKSPVLEAEQFTAWNIDYAAYTNTSNAAEVTVSKNGTAVKTDRLTRGTKGSYGETNVAIENMAFTLVCGSSEVSLGVSMNSHPDIEATLSPDAVCSFDAFGRSNTESNAASWQSGGKYMRFEDVLWSVNENGAGSGWYNDRLLLTNGAKMVLTADDGYHPFNDSDKPVGFKMRDTGMTIEIEYSTANVTDTDAELITCLGTLSNGNRYGLVVTPEEAKFLTGVVTEAVDAGEIISYEDSVGTKFEPGKNMRITYVFYPNVSTNEQRTLIGFYVNGEESASSKWYGKVNFDIISELAFNSVGADLAVKSVRIYNKALSDDEVLNNYIVDRGHLDDTDDEKGVRTLDEENRVLNEGDTVSMEKLMALMAKRKNSIIVMYGTGSVGSTVPSESDTMNVMDALAQLNDKKGDKLVRELRFYNGEDRSLDFILYNVIVRIQGTSSVNYSRKNLRIYFQKTASGWVVTLSYGEIDGNGNQTNPTVTTGKKNFFKLRQNSVPTKLACAKCDFSDSSMTTNTGGAKFFNDGMKEMGLLTPAQRYAQDHGLDDDYRSAIDGLPCDLFVAKSVDDDLIYYGQYNLNNEKSESYPLWGMDETIGDEKWGEGDTINYLEADEEGVLGEKGKRNFLPICIETLNNSNDLCLFHYLPSTDANHADFMDNNFDGGFELNHPKDTFWNGGKGDASKEPNMKEHIGQGDKYDKMYKSIDRMMSFVYNCAKETEACKNLAYDKGKHTFTGVDYEDDGDKFPTSKWISPTFRNEAYKYFDVPRVIAYYLFVNFNLGVDQLAKNMMLKTLDGIKWWIDYYDGDCQFGNDNIGFSSGKYNDNRQTKRDGAYVLQGHNSWLWNMIQANFSDMMEQIMVSGVNGGSSFMSAFSVQKAIDYFDKGQMGRWCKRLYNKSGIFKYVYPYLNPMKVGADGVEQTYPQIYGLKGSLEAHRNYFIRRRYDLKQVEYGYVSTLGAQVYQSTASLDAGYVLKPVQFVLTIPYRVQLSTSNGVQVDSGLVDAGTSYSLQLRGTFGENDPLKIIGAQKIRELVWHEDAFAIGFNFGLFTSLVKLDMSVDRASGYRNSSFMTSTQTMLLLEEMNMRNNMLARNGDNGSVATLDLSVQARLKKLDLRGTGLTKVTLATGAPVTELALPETIEELFLENLTKLTDSGLTLEGISNVTGYRYNNTPGVAGWAILNNLHSAKKAGTGKLERFSIIVDMEDDGSILREFYDYKTYAADGGYDNSHSGLQGKIHLTKYLEDAEYNRFAARYSELEIIQPEYTMIEFDNSVSDDANISNLDNNTGYKFGNQYAPSGHLTAIFAQRHRVLAKMTKKATEREINIANVDTTVNNLDGEMTYYPLDDTNSNLYVDGTAAKLDGTEGDWMMYEPGFWSKGINDYFGGKNYGCYSFRDKDNMPSVPEAKVITYDDILAAKNVRTGYKLLSGKANLTASQSADSNYSVCKVDVTGYKKVRFPTVIGTNMICSLFTAEDNSTIVDTIIIESIGADFENGMYVIVDVPSGARWLNFTIQNTAEFDKVVLSNSSKVEDMEPDWVWNDEHLCGVVGSSVVGNKLRSCITGGSTSGNMPWTDYHYYSVQRGMQQIDAMMHSRIANLFYAKYGRRGSQEQCGAGQHTNNRTTGGTAKYGMLDTIGYDEAKTINPKVTYSLVDNLIPAYAWYKGEDDYGNATVTQVNNTCCIGYENIFGNKYDMMDNVDMPNTSGNSGKWRIFMPDGSIRWVKGKTAGGQWTKAVAHGKYMDVIPVGSFSGSSSTYYCDIYDVSTAAGRVVFRGRYYAYAHGGVSDTNASYDSANVNGNVGSRLAFRGKIVKAASVAAYKAAVEVA